MVGLYVFSLGLPESYLQNGKKTEGGSSWNKLPKIPLTLDFHLHRVGFFFSFDFFLSLFTNVLGLFFFFDFFFLCLLTCLAVFYFFITNVLGFFFFFLWFFFFPYLLITNVLGFFFVFVFSSLSLILSGRVSFLHFFFFLGTHMFIFLLILVGFCFCSLFFLENSFGLIFYAIFFFFALMKCLSTHNFLKV